MVRRPSKADFARFVCQVAEAQERNFEAKLKNESRLSVEHAHEASPSVMELSALHKVVHGEIADDGDGEEQGQCALKKRQTLFSYGL